ncbi:AsmA protein [Sphingobium herbicidovorans NBRC 16415]|uniref:AsmA protein n=1 Tax=Sphingobium herbicidovorans (strain ATCC 700291 / DSM 11019 / CCUG 56400 / KCTC 2939 / LMG 18315 / NBRC 16415 / MH) TaxID=1219045 RepID=A0A086P507_SPHHM|nr:AsmA family protein [Sphingobium herbicidovorans]KFG88475.1 AsmA protein [Sphingobium herbicidovorans NBRC 16415]
MADADPPRLGKPDPEAPPPPSPAGGLGHYWSRVRARWRKVPLPVRIIGYIIAVLFLLWLTLFITKGRFLKHPFERFLTSRLERTVEVEGDFQLYFAPLAVKFRAEKMAIANTPWASRPDFFRADLIDARIAPLSLVFGDKYRIGWLELRNAAADLEWSRDGKSNSWTFGDPGKKGEPLDLPLVRRALLAGTTIRYRDPRMLLATDIRFETVKAQDTRFASDIRFSGDGTMRDRRFTLRGGLLSPNETVTGGKNSLALHAQSGATVLEVSGTLPGATEIEGADLRLLTHGPNLALLFDFLGVAIPETRAYRFTSALARQEDAWRFTHLKGRFGDSDLAGRMIVSRPENRLHIKADLTTRTLDIVDVGPFIGYDPERLKAQGADGAIENVGGAPRILPDAKLRADALRNFDASVRYDVRRIRAPNVPISNVGLTVALERSLLSLSPLTFDMSGGHVSSDIEINARTSPVRTRYDIRLSPTPMGTLLGRWGVEQSGTTGIIKARAQLTGLGDTVHDSLATSDGRIAVILPAGAMWARNVQLSELDIGTFITKMFEKKLKEPVQINCGLIAFTVRNGIAAADPIIIDTRKNVMLGRGGFSFRNESLDLAFRADGKKFSLFSGQSPVGIKGYFARPSIDVISPELMARGGAAAALGIAASPLAAVLAFVDVGDAKSAACGPVLAGATAAAQRTKGGEPRDDVGRGTTAKDESGKSNATEKKAQKKKFLGIF